MPPPPCRLFVPPQTGEPKFLPTSIHRLPPPTFFFLLSVNPPDYKAPPPPPPPHEGRPPISFTPIKFTPQLKRTGEKGRGWCDFCIFLHQTLVEFVNLGILRLVVACLNVLQGFDPYTTFTQHPAPFSADTKKHKIQGVHTKTH